MNTITPSIEGKVYDGCVPEVHDCQIFVQGKTVTLYGDHFNGMYEMEFLEFSVLPGTENGFISFPDGYQFQGDSDEISRKFADFIPSSGLCGWLEKRLLLTVLVLIVIFLQLLMGYRFGIPFMAELYANHIPLTNQEILDGQLLSGFEETTASKESKLSNELQSFLNSDFQQLMYEYSPSLESIKLHFRRNDLWGEYAIALPGGNILVSDQLFEISKSREEIIAILAHEVGHVHHHHGLRNLLQSSSMALFMAILTGDAATVGATVSDLPLIFLEMRYSNKYEEEADRFAIDVLQQNGIPVSVFTDILQRLYGNMGQRDMGENSFGSTKSTLMERIEKIHSYERL